MIGITTKSLSLMAGTIILSASFGVGVARAADTDVTLSIDASKTGAPISKYIYGQFAEHLGRSIYGGLWAEMIEDRKFGQEITDDYKPFDVAEDNYGKPASFVYLKNSPWKVIGPKGTVTMDKTLAYVGDWSPVIHLPGNGMEAGISQGNEPFNGAGGFLAVEKGKKYVGHIVLAGDVDAGPVTVKLANPNASSGLRVWSVDKLIDKLDGEWKSYPLEFASLPDSDQVTLSITAKGKGTFRIGAISLMPADNVKGWRADTLTELKKLDAPLLRWPGGNFVSGYNWRDGIDPNRDKRPPRANPAWKNIEHNDVGIHEFMELCDLIKTEPYVALNMGKGSVEEAAAEVQYIVGAADTPMGRMRAANGRKDPWTEKFWAVGNEMYGTWQLGYMPVDLYVLRHNAAAKLIRAEAPSATLVACGDTNTKGWDSRMLADCGPNMNLLSLHTYVHEVVGDPYKHSVQLRDSIHGILSAFRGYNQPKIKVAFDEWNFWYGNYVYGELGTQYRLKDALGVTMGLHEFYRNSDIVELACFAQTVNVLGAIKTSRTAATLEGSGEVLALYRHQFGTIPIEIKQPAPDLDIAAAWTDDHKTITISIVNATSTPRTIDLDLGKTAIKNGATRWEITGATPQAHNEPDGYPNLIRAVQKQVTFEKKLESPAYSAELYRLELN
ncbi:MAG TPA: alpha-L-arabinofuranosidase C-terminal domain-containing protein [Humisphaera sp.]|jgi:alpha-N-arabinofuranosidase|nr:alpha-L-arabinofuranosidase C-terminal domain-containing protein [Humisphaera sp.]